MAVPCTREADTQGWGRLGGVARIPESGFGYFKTEVPVGCSAGS